MFVIFCFLGCFALPAVVNEARKPGTTHDYDSKNRSFRERLVSEQFDIELTRRTFCLLFFFQKHIYLVPSPLFRPLTATSKQPPVSLPKYHVTMK
jgi:hypothetical protein